MFYIIFVCTFVIYIVMSYNYVTLMSDSWTHTGVASVAMVPGDDPEDDIPLSRLIQRTVTILDID